MLGMAWAAVGAVSELLRQLQQEGSAAYGIRALGGGFSARGLTDTATSAITLWKGVNPTATELFVNAYTIVDAVFIVIYGFFVAILLHRYRHVSSQYHWQLALGILMAADLVENLARFSAFHLAGRDGRPPAVAVWIAWIAEKGKFVALTVVVLMVLVVVHDLVTVPRGGMPDKAGPWSLSLQAFKISAAADATFRRTVHAIVVLRGQLMLAVTFAALLLIDVTGQVGDILRRWTSAGGVTLRATAVIGILSVVILGIVLWSSCRRIILADEQQSRLSTEARRTSRLFRQLLIAAAVVAGITSWVFGSRIPLGLPIVLACVALLDLVSCAIARTQPSMLDRSTSDAQVTTVKARGVPETQDRMTYQHVARWLALIPPAALGIALVRAAVGPLILACLRGQGYDGPSAIALLTLGLLTLVGTAKPLHGWLQSQDRKVTEDLKQLESRHIVAAGLVAIGIFLLVLSPLSVPPVFGAVAVLSLAMAGLGILFAELLRFSEVAEPPRGLTMLFFRRVPVFILLASWIAVASAFDDGSYHQIRKLAGPPQATDLSTVWNEWKASNCVDAKGDPVPLVIVAAEGGGIRAAYWTASVLTDLLPPAQVSGCQSATARSRLFAVSGISGGSVGTVSYLATPEPKAGWFKAALGEPDYVATPLATGLLIDLPRTLVGFHSPDRAAWLERAWEAKVKGLEKDYFVDLKPGKRVNGWMPLTLLNGAQVETGCRVSTSAVRLTNDPVTDCRSVRERDNTLQLRNATGLAVPAAPVTLDTVVHLGRSTCRTSIRSSTAALLSARWPYISPSGQLPCRPPLISVVDGGYADGSGAAAAMDLWEELQPLVAEHNAEAGTSKRLVIPLFVRIDNHYTSTAKPRAPERTSEPLAVPLSKLRAGSTVNVDRKQRAAAAISSTVPGLLHTSCKRPGQPPNGEFLLSPTTRPGLPAPLAWTLAPSSRQDLDDQRDDLFETGAGAALRDLLTGRTAISCQP
jgi:hypothetical protein